MSTVNIAYGTYTPMTITNLESLATDSTNDTYGAWQSERVDNRTTLADDYEIFVDLVLTTGTPANDFAAYVYLVPWVYNGSAWVPGGNFSTATAPTGSEGTAALSDPNSMKGPISIPAKVQSQHLQAMFTVSSLCGGIVPDGWSLAIRNNTGINLTTGNVVAYRPITYTVA